MSVEWRFFEICIEVINGFSFALSTLTNVSKSFFSSCAPDMYIKVRYTSVNGLLHLFGIDDFRIGWSGLKRTLFLLRNISPNNCCIALFCECVRQIAVAGSNGSVDQLKTLDKSNITHYSENKENRKKPSGFRWKKKRKQNLTRWILPSI